MAVAGGSLSPAEQRHEPVSRLDRRGRRTRLIRPARAIHFARGNARNTDLRTLGAKDRAVTIPHRSGRALEGLSGWNDRRCRGRIGWWEKIPTD
jgi:hypothetical protein